MRKLLQNNGNVLPDVTISVVSGIRAAYREGPTTSVPEVKTISYHIKSSVVLLNLKKYTFELF